MRTERQGVYKPGPPLQTGGYSDIVYHFVNQQLSIKDMLVSQQPKIHTGIPDGLPCMQSMGSDCAGQLRLSIRGFGQEPRDQIALCQPRELIATPRDLLVAVRAYQANPPDSHSLLRHLCARTMCDGLTICIRMLQRGVVEMYTEKNSVPDPVIGMAFIFALK